MNVDNESGNSIKASPTKEFFISMLTRDISTDRAILDLIDNSIDAATQSGKVNATINLTINSNTFSISDDAGGLDLEIAVTDRRNGATDVRRNGATSR